MTVVVAQGGFIDEGFNAVRLARYAQLTQQECAFWGVRDPSEPVNEACDPLLTLPQRVQIARYLGEAQDEIEQVCGFPLSPRWFADELPYACTVHAKRKKIIEMGVMATSVVSSGEIVDYTTEPAQIGPIATTVTDPDEIHVYHPGTDFEIDPSAITISGGNVTIEIPRCRLVIDPDNPEDGWDYTDVGTCMSFVPVPGTFECEVDVKRVYNDPTTQATLVWPHATGESLSCQYGCGCYSCGEYTHEACAYIRNEETGAIDIRYAHIIGSVWTIVYPCSCSSPELVRVYYRAGMTPLSRQAEDAIIHLAHAKMPKPSCGCGVLRDKWDADRVVPDNLTAEQTECPFGSSVGAWIAWKFANAMRIYKLGVL